MEMQDKDEYIDYIKEELGKETPCRALEDWKYDDEMID